MPGFWENEIFREYIIYVEERELYSPWRFYIKHKSQFEIDSCIAIDRYELDWNMLLNDARISEYVTFSKNT